jgi:hypothetical protein
MKPLLLENKVPAMLLAAECHLRMSEPTPISEQFDRIEALHLITPQLSRRVLRVPPPCARFRCILPKGLNLQENSNIFSCRMGEAYMS